MGRKNFVLLTPKLQTLNGPRFRGTTLRSIAGLVLLFSLMAVGCSQKPTTKKLEPADKGITVDAQKGPVSLSLSLSPTKPDTTTPARLTIQLLADASVTVTLANYAIALRDMDTYYDYRLKLRHKEVASPLANGQLRWRLEYDVTFTLAGDYEFPSAVATFEKATIAEVTTAHTSSKDSTTLQTEPLTVTVVDVVDKELTPEELASIETLSPVELPQKWSRWWWLGPLLAVAGLAALALLLYLAGKVFPPARRLLSWLRRRLTGDELDTQVEIIPAHIWARRALAALVSEDLISRGLVQPFYYRISDVMRGYIERRFDVHAPEMTTEEFLTTAGDDPRFPSSTTEQLEKFLEACDLVKYARMQPNHAQADQLVQAADHFVEATYLPAPPADLTSADTTDTQQEVAV